MFELSPHVSMSQKKEIEVGGKRIPKKVAIPKGLTEEQVEEIRKSFELIDINGDGRLSKSELMKAAALLGLNPTEKDVTEMMKSVDVDGDGFISFKEYVELMRGNYDNINMEAERLKAAFKTLDKNKDGFISMKEFKVAVMYNDDSIVEEEVEEFFREFDKDGDGKLDYNEFVDSDLCSVLF